MRKKTSIKNRLAYMAYQQNGLNRRAVSIKKSLDEINKILNPRNTK